MGVASVVRDIAATAGDAGAVPVVRRYAVGAGLRIGLLAALFCAGLLWLGLSGLGILLGFTVALAIGASAGIAAVFSRRRQGVTR